ncbi:hypothetical protein, partial [Marinobacter alexandrii]|uniref:hypothetical protein n=1 Tax=Marinobacter alexandrii TaxID=2570351 RepID=UPI003263E956
MVLVHIQGHHATGVSNFLPFGSKLRKTMLPGVFFGVRSGSNKGVTAIDREFPAVRITDCLKTGVNTAGNPERVTPVNH